MFENPIRYTDRAERRIVLIALGIALLFHGVVAGGMGWYHLKGIEIPNDHSKPTGPFTVKEIQLNPSSLNPNLSDPVKLPSSEPPKTSAQFALDPHLVVKALQAPLPHLSTPAVPDADRVLATTDVSPTVPFTESDVAKVTSDISKVQPAANEGPLVSTKLTDEVINTSLGPTQAGTLTGAPNGAVGSGKVPGFADLASQFKPGGPNVSNLPDPVLLRLPSDVLFDFNSAVLKPQADPLLAQAIGMITKYPSAEVQIDGYTDSFGQPNYNLTLSQQRAQAVQGWLQTHVTQQGYAFRSQGHGSSNYVVDSHGTIDQQQQNRRVEILIQALK